jgi:hypothetical protein
MVKSLQSCIQNGSNRSLPEWTNVPKTGDKKEWRSPYYNCCLGKRYGNPEKNYLRMEEKTPQQELAELRATDNDKRSKSPSETDQEKTKYFLSNTGNKKRTDQAAGYKITDSTSISDALVNNDDLEGFRA